MLCNCCIAAGVGRGEAKAADIARLARKLKLTHMTADCLPAFDLPSVLVGHSSPHVVQAVPCRLRCRRGRNSDCARRRPRRPSRPPWWRRPRPAWRRISPHSCRQYGQERAGDHEFNQPNDARSAASDHAIFHPAQYLLGHPRGHPGTAGDLRFARTHLREIAPDRLGAAAVGARPSIPPRSARFRCRTRASSRRLRCRSTCVPASRSARWSTPSSGQHGTSASRARSSPPSRATPRRSRVPSPARRRRSARRWWSSTSFSACCMKATSIR